MTRLIPRPRLLFAALLVANAVAWSIPGNVVKNVARDRHTLLGRYSYQQFLWMLALLVGSVVAMYIARGPDRRARRIRAFKVVTLIVSMAIGATLVDIPLRLKDPPLYRLDRMAFRRPANATWKFDFEDRPEARRSYPVLHPGYGRVVGTFTFDATASPTHPARTKYDIVALGDSFTEGSRVTDADAWPARVAAATGRSVYNLGQSGYSPQHYVASLKVEGLKLAPKVVICTLYEGNDFRAAEVITESKIRVKQVFRSSPILQTLDRLLTERLGAIGATRELAELDVLSWLPMALPDGPNARYYAFAPKQIIDLCGDIDNFRQSRKWKIVTDTLTDLHETCRSAGADLLLVYIPEKAHVVLPPAADRLPADKVRAFVALATDALLPEPATFLTEVLARIEAREALVAAWCRTQSIRFLSLTPALREAALSGRQVYYTYDQHWTPVGHEVAANAIYGILNNSGTSASR